MIYRFIFKRAIYPFFERVLHNRHTLGHANELLKTQWLPEEDIKILQWQRLQNLLTHAYTQSPYYRQIFDELEMHPQDVSSYEDFSRLPILTRQKVIKNKSRMLAEAHPGTLIHKTTGGTTGTPMPLALDADSNEWRMAMAQRGYQWAHCDPGEHILHIWSVDAGNQAFLPKLKLSLYNRFFNRKMFNCFNFDEKEMTRCLDYINARKPSGIVAYTTAIYDLAQFIHNNNLFLDTTAIRSIITGAEKLYEYQRELIERVFEAPVFNTYGCREFMLIAAECEKHEGLHLSMENLFVEILVDGRPAKPGETGDIVVTDLRNLGMPFIRYKNGDMAVQGKSLCSCGRGLTLIHDIEGRKVDQITAIDGRKVSGVLFPMILRKIKGIYKFQIIQKTMEHILIKVIESEKVSEESFDFCRQEIKKVLGDEVTVEFVLVNDIPLNASGKYRTTLSEVA